MERNELTKEIGKRIRNERRKQELNQEELAYRAGIHTSYFGCIERGEKCPTIETIIKICKALDISVSSIIPENNVPKLSPEERMLSALRKLSPDKQEYFADIIESIAELMT